MSTAVILEPNDLDKLIKAITDTVREELGKMRTENHDKPMNGKQAAAFIGIHVNTFYNRFKTGEYPSRLMHGKGRLKHFFASELEAFIKKS